MLLILAPGNLLLLKLAHKPSKLRFLVYGSLSVDSPSTEPLYFPIKGLKMFTSMPAKTNYNPPGQGGTLKLQ